MLVSQHVPHLTDVWQRIEDHGVHYVSYKHGMHLQQTDGGVWNITQDGFALARSFADARHPNTVRAGEWEICVTYPDGWQHHPKFAVLLTDLYTEVHTLDDLGDDYFIRVPQTKPVCFTHEGKLYHSGAKNNGWRYCHLCEQLVSGNNFVSQHMRNMHLSEWKRLRNPTCP